jgi:hypothetical protein
MPALNVIHSPKLVAAAWNTKSGGVVLPLFVFGYTMES